MSTNSNTSETTLSLKTIADFFNSKANEYGAMFNDMVMLELSFERFYSNMKFYGKSGQKVCYLQVIDRNGYKATVVCPQELYESSHKRYNFNAGKSIDIRLKSVSVGRDGRLQLTIKSIRENGISELELTKRKIIEYCEHKGYFSRSKKMLPSVISKIALLTTKTGNTASDIIEQIGLKTECVELYQCDSNGHSIANAIEMLSKQGLHQLIVLFRGGNEDQHMIEFSRIEVLDAIVNSHIPVASAIGHEADKPIVQSIADVGFDTPSSFAKEIAKHNMYFSTNVNNRMESIKNSFNRIVTDAIEKNSRTSASLMNTFGMLELLRRNKKQNRIMLISAFVIVVIAITIAIFR